MKRKNKWPIVVAVLAVIALLAAACGPELPTSTPGAALGDATAGAPTAAPTVAATTPATKPSTTVPTPTPAGTGTLPVDQNDWHVLGSADAPVTMIEYSEFQ